MLSHFQNFHLIYNILSIFQLWKTYVNIEEGGYSTSCCFGMLSPLTQKGSIQHGKKTSPSCCTYDFDWTCRCYFSDAVVGRSDQLLQNEHLALIKCLSTRFFKNEVRRFLFNRRFQQQVLSSLGV